MILLLLLPETTLLLQAEGQQLTQAVVTRIIDGDTFDAVINGKRDRVRPIGVDAPEATSKVEPYGREATEFTRRWLSGKTVWLERDVDPRDRFERFLAYVWLKPSASRSMTEIRSRMFNAILLAEGYAQLLTIPPNVRYVDAFRVLQIEARQKGKGLWATSSRARTAPTPVSRKQCDPSYPDVCIPPPPPDLGCRDIPHRRFRVLPPDPHKFDGDRDGIGCET